MLLQVQSLDQQLRLHRRLQGTQSVAAPADLPSQSLWEALRAVFALTDLRRAGHTALTPQEQGSRGATVPSPPGKPQGITLPKCQLQPRASTHSPAPSSHKPGQGRQRCQWAPLWAWHHQDPRWTRLSPRVMGLGLRDRSQAATAWKVRPAPKARGQARTAISTGGPCPP